MQSKTGNERQLRLNTITQRVKACLRKRGNTKESKNKVTRQ